jgi:hypothetical protein
LRSLFSVAELAVGRGTGLSPGCHIKIKGRVMSGKNGSLKITFHNAF